jgi:hypothetical protein
MSFAGIIKNLLETLYYLRRIRKGYAELSVLRDIDASVKIEQIEVKNTKLRIAFIIPGMTKFSGGRTSILRIGTQLTRFEHDVFYITYDGSKKKKMVKNAKVNLPAYMGEICEKEALVSEYDIGIATNWISAYHLCLNMKSFSVKAYFIQDFEPAFYPEGDRYYLALKTYALKLKMISLGEWSAKRIQERIPGADVKIVDFPVELKQYILMRREIKIEKELNLAVYLKPEAKRGMEVIFQGLQLLDCVMRRKGIACNINIFGMDKRILTPVGRNLGKLKHDELMKLYSRSHIGIIASFTNISLVPFEMIATGLPVVEWKDGSAPVFFGEKSMFFVDILPADFVGMIVYLIDHQHALNDSLKIAQNHIARKTWENTAMQLLGHIVK